MKFTPIEKKRKVQYPRRGSKWLSKLFAYFAKLTGWKIIGQLPNLKKFVAIGYPHTSNWDFMPFVYISYILGVKISFFAKASLFRFPLGFFLRAFGGIPIERRYHHGVVKQTIQVFKNKEKLVVGVMPEGTRNPVDKEWKRGFYFIAKGANVPIVLGLINHKTKTVHIMEPFVPGDDVESDMQILYKMAASCPMPSC